MPSSSQTGGALSGAASGAITGAQFGGPVGAVIGGVIGGVSGYLGAGKKVDIAKVIAQAKATARDNLQTQINLENELLPGTARLRAGSNALNAQLASGGTQAQRQQAALLAQGPLTDASSAVDNPLTMSSMSSILQSLNRGGKLDADAQAQAVQAALQKGGAAGISGSGAGRGLVARDLGLTAMQVLQGRQNQAAAAGNQYANTALAGQQLTLNDFLARLNGVNTAVGQNQQYGLGLGELMNKTAYPASGLGPAGVADLMVQANAQNNAINKQTQANITGAFNQFGGAMGAGTFSDMFKTNPIIPSSGAPDLGTARTSSMGNTAYA